MKSTLPARIGGRLRANTPFARGMLPALLRHLWIDDADDDAVYLRAAAVR